MPRFYDLLTDRGKQNLIKKARELGMLHFSPDDGRGEPAVKAQGKLEDSEEIGVLMAMSDAQIKERYD